MRPLLDTSIVIAADVGELEGELAISSVTLAELHSASWSPRPPRRGTYRGGRRLVIQGLTTIPAECAIQPDRC